MENYKYCTPPNQDLKIQLRDQKLRQNGWSVYQYDETGKPVKPWEGTQTEIQAETEEPEEYQYEKTGGSGCSNVLMGAAALCAVCYFQFTKEDKAGTQQPVQTKPPAGQILQVGDDAYVGRVKSIAQFKEALQIANPTLVVRIGHENKAVEQTCNEAGVEIVTVESLSPKQERKYAQSGPVLFHYAKAQ